jgi:hypothetical protein
VIKFVSDIRQVDGFFPGSPVDTTNKTDHHDITEILLKVALSTHKQKLAPVCANTITATTALILELVLQFESNKCLNTIDPFLVLEIVHVNKQKLAPVCANNLIT